MRVQQLWRFPVKSMPGERVERVEIGERGVVGDRCFALRDCTNGTVLSAKREGKLLLRESLPSRDAAELSAWIGRPVELVSAEGRGPSTYENPMDPFNETDWMSWQGPAGSFVDSTRTQVSLVSTTSLRDWDLRRFRINIILDGEGEDALVGRRVAIGSAVLDVVKPIARCVMVTRAQAGGVERDVSVLKTILAERGGDLGIAAMVVQTGAIEVGDELRSVTQAP